MSISDNPLEGTVGSMLPTFIRRGRSFSGHERNCCFLNLGQNVRRYADISSISGFDFPDDGRAVARVDWDHDGDLDFWIANRSGPQVRFLRNDVPSGHHYLALRLVGRDCNRDAIGARVELFLKGSDQKLIKTLRAGDGFLAQSSKWLHFGLGAATEVVRLSVHWPGGEREHFRGLHADSRYRIEQGQGNAEAWATTQRVVRLEASELAAPVSSERIRVLSAARLPVPSLRYQTFDGRTLPVIQSTESPPRSAATLVILWASWCRPCLVELREIADRGDELRSAGLDVVALSVDSLDEKSGVTPSELKELMEEFRFPFASGLASEPTVEKLQMVHDRLFDLHRTFPVPVSFMMNAAGELAVLYRGPVDVKQLLGDVRKVSATGDVLRRESLPFTGRWLRPPKRMSPFWLASDLFVKGYTEEGFHYVATHRNRIENHYRFPKLTIQLGNARLARREPAMAVAHYREAIALDSQDVYAWNNLAWILATHPDPELRDGAEAVQLAEEALRKSKGMIPVLWDTLSAAYAEVGQYDKAVAAATKGHALARRLGDTRRAQSIRNRLELYQNSLPYRAK